VELLGGKKFTEAIMYLALYRAYRPETFEEVLGQDHIIKILQNQLKTDTVGHAYLFCGSRGTGKTTIARLLAKGVNCESEGEHPCGVCENCLAIKAGIFMDVIEIDAATNNGVDNIRELRESVKYPPAAGKKKVYIVDEVHMLSLGAFNAFLKTLEEPPESVLFILATTEPQKLPATILSRCMRLDFRRVSEELLQNSMGKICHEKGIDVSEPALRLIAAKADGSVRDGLSILDQCIAAGEKQVSREDVLSLIGASGEETFIAIADQIRNGKTDEALLSIDKAMSAGIDAKQFLKDMLAHYRNLLIAKYIKNPEDVLNLSAENAERVKQQSEVTPVHDISKAIVEISKTAAEAKWSTQPRILLELCVVMLSGREETCTPIPTPVPKPAAKPAPTPSPAKTEKGDLWESLFEGEDGLKGSAMMIRTAGFRMVSETEYVVAAQSDSQKDNVEKNKKAIEELLKKRTGANIFINCIVEKQEKAEKTEKQIDKLAEEAGNILGLAVEIDDE